VITGDEDRAPVRVSVPQSGLHAGAEAALAALVAHFARLRTGRGQHVDVSAQQAVTIATQSDAVAVAVGESGAARYSGGAKMGPLVLRLVFPASDGHVSITHVFGSAIGPATVRLMHSVHADGFCDEEMRDKDWVGFGELLATGRETFDSIERAKACIAAWTASLTKAELLILAQERGLLIAPVATPRDVAESEQLASRGYFQEVEQPALGRSVRQPGPFARFGARPLSYRRPAPQLGEHDVEVQAEPDRQPTLPDSPTSSGSELPLAGLKVLDFMWAIAGPMSTRMLCDYGATVVRVETSSRPDACRTMRPFVDSAPDPDGSALFHVCNAGKHMLTLDLAKPEGLAVALDLARWADVVTESFTPGTLEKLGLGYEALRAVNPRVIMLSTCLMGQSGPMARYAGYGNLAAAIAGFFELTGWPDRDPAGPFGAYTDYFAPRLNASAVLAALEYRRRTGEGQHIDLAQAETALHFLAPALLDYTVNGHVATREGNRDPVYAPHGCYPTAGKDRWIALAVDGDAQWATLCEALGQPELARDPRFGDVASRHTNADALDRTLSDLTRKHELTPLESLLQSRGIPAHAVLDSEGLGRDPQLVHRGHFVAYSDGGRRGVIEAARSRLSRTPARVPDRIPTLGRDTQEVLSQILGYDDERITELAIAEALE
jgi:crotonobetainyl-CoA:carnitine CoA-transferase CaiB-like acyl-CoA transferase